MTDIPTPPDPDTETTLDADLAAARARHATLRGFPEVPGFEEWYARGFDLRAEYPEIDEAMDEHEFSTEDIALLRRLIDPRYDVQDRTRDELVEWLCAFEAYIDSGDDDQYDDLGQIVAETTAIGGARFGPGSVRIDVPGPDRYGETPFYSVSLRLGPEAGDLHLTTFEDPKYLADGDRERSGLRAAVAAAAVFEADVRRVLDRAELLGLLPTDTTVTTPPRTEN